MFTNATSAGRRSTLASSRLVRAEMGRLRLVGNPWARCVETSGGRRDNIVRGNGNKS